MWHTLINENIHLENGIIIDKRIIGQDCFVIYMYENLINNKKYIGKTNNLRRRHIKHFSVARCKKEKEYMAFHKAINKYGVDNFSLKIIDVDFNEDEAYIKELKWISEFKTNDRDFGYNLCDGGKHPNSGRIVSQETREKISRVHKGKTVSEETKKKISLAKIGTVVSDETKLKMSKIKIGKTQTEETKQKIRQYQVDNSPTRGKKMTPEDKQKISEGTRGSYNHFATVNEDTVKLIKYLFNVKHYTRKNISIELNVSINIVRSIIRGDTWKHVQ